MAVFKAVNLLDSIVPISRFNKGEANKIFKEVKTKGIKIVVKNNAPECVLISPKEYQEMMEKYEDALLLLEANKRLSQKVDYISHEDILKDMNISEDDLKEIDVDLE
ncbi:Prevent-host-death protein [Gracilinema caldarium DSM 7334]|uniref:Antitoxin n=2 Tax=Gracilinema caldarium TaxID=215591 RepID=F8F3Z5_GRAC1|nr:Prevent-host-death protein [Gracilinema caldarium DSM 7334]